MARDDTRSKKQAVRKASPGDDRCVVGSEVGVTIPVGDTTAHLRFSFWSERMSKNSTLTEIKKTAAAVDEFNEEELERRMKKYKRLIDQILAGDDEDEPRGKTKKAGKVSVSVRDRAQARIK